MEPLSEEDQNQLDEMTAKNLGADAVFHVRHVNTMHEEGKLAIAEWLRHQAEMLLADGHNYAVIFTARYNPEDEG